jgi:hypothetical protein
MPPKCALDSCAEAARMEDGAAVQAKATIGLKYQTGNSVVLFTSLTTNVDR